MRELDVQRITEAVASLCVAANIELPQSLCDRIAECAQRERNPVAQGVFGDMLENLRIAKEQNLPICQDTGMAVVFAEIGQEVHLVGGSFEEAIHRGVAKGYTEGYLRCSVVADPLRRVNTGDNTPAVIHTRLVPGDRVRLTVAPKGFGSENMSTQKMLTPSASPEDITEFVAQAVVAAGSNPCPPVVVGVGIGGDFELCALLAKRALCRDVAQRNPDPFYAQLEADMLARINASGVGAQGFGGDITALAVAIEAYPTHIAGLPVAVNMGCHVTRHKSITL